MENKPLVSVVIPTYNREEYLDNAILSVVNQTYTNIEILVVDDGSKHNYAENLCSKYKQCVYWYKENGGLSSARNFGIKNAKGDYIALLDDDDFWHPTKIEKQVAILLENPHVDCVHSAAAVVDENSIPTGKNIGASQNKAHKRSGYVFWNALGNWVVKSPTPLFRREVFKSDLIFDESIRVGEDVDFYQRMFYRHKVYYIEEALAFYREYNNSERLSLQRMKYIGIEKKMYDNFKKMGIKNPILLYQIAKRLLFSAQRTWNEVYGCNTLKINKFDIYFRPAYCLSLFINRK